MDDLDRKLIHELQEHGLQKSEDLVGSIGLGGRAIRKRLSDMKKQGIFRTVTIPNHVLLGHRAWAKIGIKVSPGKLLEAAEILVDNPEINTVACSFGKYDFIIDIHLETFEELAHFVNVELSMIPGIQYKETMILMTPRKYYDYRWPEPKFNQKCKYCHNTIVLKNGIDDFDRKIIEVLKQDGITTPSRLKSRLSMSEGTIRKRIKDMLRHDMFKIQVIPDASVSGYGISATIGVVVNNRSPHEVIDQIIESPLVNLASTSIGRFSIILSASFQNLDLFEEFTRNNLANIPGVSNIESFLHTRLLKLHNIKWTSPVPTI